MNKMIGRVAQVQGTLNKIKIKSKKYKRKQQKILYRTKKTHKRTYWMVAVEVVGIIATNIFQIVFIKNQIIKKTI